MWIVAVFIIAVKINAIANWWKSFKISYIGLSNFLEVPLKTKEFLTRSAPEYVKNITKFWTVFNILGCRCDENSVVLYLTYIQN